jgi:hypothetical protein
MPKLDPKTIYRAFNSEHGRTVLFRYVKPSYEDGEEWHIGIDLGTGYTCRVYPPDWTFHELSELEKELW